MSQVEVSSSGELGKGFFYNMEVLHVRFRYWFSLQGTKTHFCTRVTCTFVLLRNFSRTVCGTLPLSVLLTMVWTRQHPGGYLLPPGGPDRASLASKRRASALHFVTRWPTGAPLRRAPAVGATQTHSTATRPRRSSLCNEPRPLR